MLLLPQTWHNRCGRARTSDHQAHGVRSATGAMDHMREADDTIRTRVFRDDLRVSKTLLSEDWVPGAVAWICAGHPCPKVLRASEEDGEQGA